MAEKYAGVAVRRLEDERFLKGIGTYTDDIKRPNQTVCVFVRSPIAHGRIVAINTDAAKAAPGVVAVFTQADIQPTVVGGLPCGWLITDPHGQPMKEPPHPILAHGKVRHVGDPVVAVIAESLSQAKDAAELVDVQYEELPPVVDMRTAKTSGVAVHDEAPDNVCFTWELGDRAAVDAAFANAAHTVSLDLVNNRVVPNAIEPRAAIGEFDRASGEYTLITTSQNPHVIRLLMGAFVLGIPEHKLRVYAPDVGGGFGSKIYHYAEEALVTWAAKRVGRPVKWTAERSESFVTDAHGRDHITHAELAMDAQGHFTGLRVHTTANLGGYLSTFAPAIPTWLYGTLLAGQYRTPAVYCHVEGLFTNTVPVDAYRGAGRPEACYVIERLATLAAWKLGVDQAEIRRRNFVTADQFPYQTPVAVNYDSGDFHAAMDKALALADYDGFAARRAESERKGRLRGIGIASYIEACGIAPSALAGALGARAGLYECATVRVNPTGSVTMLTGTHSHGQGHETVFAQMVADRLGIDIGQVEVVHGDTNKIPFGMGTYGSRSLAVGGSALSKAMDKVVAKATRIAAHLLEASVEDVEFRDGAFTVKGTDRAKAFGEVALAAYVPHKYPIEELEPGLEETAFYDPKNFTYPNGTYICEVEVDPETGVVEVQSFTAVDDVGTIMNPLIVEGQIHGGIGQGIGQALLESASYDANGQLVSGSYMDYVMPRADNLPSYRIGHSPVACTHNPLGAKGCGEAGAIGAPPAVINAVCDALSPYGITHIDMPASPSRVWAAIQAARPAMAAE